jgi:hypothetical protein
VIASPSLVSVLAILETSGEALCRLSSVLGQMIIMLELGHLPDGRAMAANFGEIDREAERLNLRVVSAHLGRVKEHFLGGSATRQSLYPMVLELYNRMRDDLNDRLLLFVDASHVGFYHQSELLFGNEVATGFPSILYDAEEAGKCLALERSTAAVFHSIRCLEAAIRAISRCLGVPDPTRAADRNWGSMLKEVKAEIDRRWPTSTNRLSGDGQTFDEIHAALAGIQNPWRNATMHLDQKYTEAEARHVFDVVRGLIRRVASRCDELGEPKA